MWNGFASYILSFLSIIKVPYTETKMVGLGLPIKFSEFFDFQEFELSTRLKDS